METEKEKELRSIINSDKSKSFHHDGKRYWVGKKIKEQLKNKLQEKKEGGFLPLIPKYSRWSSNNSSKIKRSSEKCC